MFWSFVVSFQAWYQLEIQNKIQKETFSISLSESQFDRKMPRNQCKEQQHEQIVKR